MQQKIFLFSFLFLLPTLFMGQVLQEIKQESKGLPDPDEYPFEIYYKLGIPAGSLSAITGHQNMQQILQDGGIDFPRFREVNVLEAGFRYNRLYVEGGIATQFPTTPSASFSNNRFYVSSDYIMGAVNLGYSVWQNRNTAVLLRLGVGYNSISYDIRTLQNLSPVDFDKLLVGEPSNPSMLISHENIFWDISVEFWKGRAKNRTNFGEAFRIGYRRGIEDTAWEAFNTTSLNSPMDRVGELYLNICFHLGSSFSPISQ